MPKFVADSAETTGLKWASPASGGMTSLVSTTLSGNTTTVNFTPTGYNYLFIDVTQTTSANGGAAIRINGDTASNYKQVSTWYTGYGSVTNQQLSTTYWNPCAEGQNGMGSGSENRTSITIYAPNSSNRKLASIFSTHSNDSGYITNSFGTYSHSTTSTVTSVTWSSSNITGGTITVWGVK